MMLAVWFHEAKNGDDNALVKLGHTFYFGNHGMQKDPLLAACFYDQAAELCNADAIRCLDMLSRKYSLLLSGRNLVEEFRRYVDARKIPW